MEVTDYSSKINELMTIKERRKLLRQIQESKRKLFYSNPDAIAPFIRDKVTDTLYRSSYPAIRHRSPVVEERTIEVVPPVNKVDNGEYLAMMREHRSLIESELQVLRATEENNRKELERRLEQLITTNGANNNANVAEIRSMLRSFHDTQLDLQKDSQPSNPVIRDLKRLKTNYLLDGGHDPQLLAEMDSVIQDAESNKMDNSNDNNLWTRRRRDLALAREKSYELRDLERQNAELERQLDLNRVRSGIQTERRPKITENNADNSKIETLQKQIEDLQYQILNLRQPQSSESLPNPIMTSSGPMVSTRSLGGDMATRNIVVLIDFMSGIGQHIRSIQVLVSVFHGLDRIGDDFVSDLMPVRQRDSTELDSSILVNVKYPIISCPATPEVFALLELHVTTESNNKPKLEGWAKLNLFDDRGGLKRGKWKELILKSPVKMNITAEEMFRWPQYHRSEVHYRLEFYSSDEIFQTPLSPSNQEPPLEYSKPNPFMVNTDARNFDIDSDDEKSDVTMDLDERPELGFQMIRIKNMSIGDGLELAKVRMTVYHTEGRKKGQILMSKDGPVTCSTNAVRADFKIACYNLGRQLARFTDAELSVDCIVYARFYLEGGATVRDDGITRERDEVLVAWTAMPVVKRRSVARRNPSYTTDSLKLLRINRGLHDLSLYEPPALPPTMVFFDKKGFIVGQKVIGRSKLKFRLFHTKIVYDSATSSDGTSLDEEELSTSRDLKVWIPIDRTEAPLLPYHHDDGFDLYIDAGRLLPDSVTIVKIEGAIVDRSLKNQGPQFSAVTSLFSDIYNPIFKQRIEVREPYLSPSSTLLLKVMTFDREDKNLVIIGYASLKIFVETGSGRQPHFDNLGVLTSLNDGGHQLRLYLTEPTISNGPFTESWFEKNYIQYIPGASLLVRLFKPPKNANGRSLNINEVPKNYQARLGVIVPAPTYEEGYYYSMNCKPTDGELKIMTQHSLRANVLLQDLIVSKWARGLQETLAFGETLESDNISRLFESSNKAVFNFNHIAHYVPTSGFKISIDGALNVPWSGYPMGHICIYPPGAMYMKKPLMAYDRPFFLSHLDLLSTQSSPIWLDAWKSYRRRKYDRNLVAILHLHEMKVSVVKNDFVFTLENQAWTPIRIFDGPYCVTKSTQMPLISGGPTLANLQELTTKSVQQFLLNNFESKKIVPVMNSSVIVRQCDGRRHMEMSVSTNNKLTLDQSYLPEATRNGYSNVFASKGDVQFNTTIPVGFNANTFPEFLKSKFKSLIYKLYEQDGFFLS